METRECPFCKEEIKAEALRCKHCHASVAVEEPTHGGICPFCKESIKAEALRCKHCKADLRLTMPTITSGGAMGRRKEPHGFACYVIKQGLDSLYANYFGLLDSGQIAEANDLMARGIQPLERAYSGMGC